MTGDGFEAASSDDYCWLSRDVTVPAGGSVELKVVIAFTTEEIPESTEQYLRFAGLGNLEAVRAQKAEYNLYWWKTCPTSTCREGRPEGDRLSLVAGALQLARCQHPRL